MSRKLLYALILLAATMICTPLLAQEPVQEPVQEQEPVDTPQDEDQEKFKLSRSTTSAEDELAFQEEQVELWVPHIRGGTVEFSFAFGFIGLDKSIWNHDQIIYKYDTDATYWGDVEITGKSAFNPAFRLGYMLTDWLSLEGIAGIAFGEYSSTIVNRRARDNKPGAPVIEDPPLGEFDAEARSLTTIQASLNAVVYFMSLIGDADGRWHPYVTAGAGGMWYDMNSNYTDKMASTKDFNFGGGVRILADRNISVRCELIMHMNEVEFTPGDYFIVLNEGTTKVPINEYPIQPDGSFIEQEVESYSSKSLSLLNFSIGVHGSF